MRPIGIGRGVYVRTFLVVLLIVFVVIGAAVVYLIVTTPKESAGVRLPLSPAQRALLANVPATAESFALIPNAAALVAQREDSRGAYPPIGRPSVSTVAISPASIDITSVAPPILPASQPTPAGLPAIHKFARNAILTANFTTAPRLIEEANRLLGTKASILLRDGGAVVLYAAACARCLTPPR